MEEDIPKSVVQQLLSWACFLMELNHAIEGPIIPTVLKLGVALHLKVFSNIQINLESQSIFSYDALYFKSVLIIKKSYNSPFKYKKSPMFLIRFHAPFCNWSYTKLNGFPVCFYFQIRNSERFNVCLSQKHNRIMIYKTMIF